MGSGASTLSAEPGSAAPFAYDPLAEPTDRKKMPELGVDLTQIAESAAALITAAEAHRDELLEGTGNFETRCDELRDSMQLEAMVTLLRGAEESAATLTQLAAALLGATGEAKDALATVDKALELAADDNEALFNAHTERGLVLLAQQQAEPAAEALKAALELTSKAKVEMPKHTLARTKRLSGACSDALTLVEGAAMRRDGKTVENFLELGNCRAACYAQTLTDTAACPEPGGKEAKQWNGKCLDLLVEAHQAFENAAKKMEKVGGHATALVSDAMVLEELYHFQQMRRLDEVTVKATEKKEDKNTIEGFCFVDPQGEITAICKNAGHYEKLTDEQQLKCLEEEYKSFKEFGVMDKAEEVQALHGWKAKEIHQQKASKKKKVATGPGAEFGLGGVKALPLAVGLLEQACEISPHRAELWLHAGRLRATAAAVAATQQPPNGDAEADTDAALNTATEELKTACALAKKCKEGSGGCPPHTEETEMCARFYLGLLLAKRTAEDGGPPSAQAKAHSQARALVAPAISAWLALLRDGGEVPQQLWGRSTPLDAERPLRGNNPDFVEAFRLCGEGLLVNGGGGEEDPDGSLARRYLRTVVEVTPHLLKQCCHASQSDIRSALQASFFSAQISLVECELSLRTQQEAPPAVLVAATLPYCEKLLAALTAEWEASGGGQQVGSALRELRQRACEQRTEIDAKRGAAWLALGEALFDDYVSAAAAKRVDDSAEVKAEGLSQRMKLLDEAATSIDKAIELEGSPNLTDEEVAAGKKHLEKLASGGGGGAKKGAAGVKGGKTAGAGAQQKKAGGAAAAKTATRGRAAAKGKGGAAGKKPAAAAAAAGGAKKGTSTDAKDVKGGTKDDSTPPAAAAAAPAASATPAPLEAADVAAAQVANAKSATARLRLADVLKETLEEVALAADGAGDAKAADGAAAAGGGGATAEETKARLVELYNQVIEIEPTNEDAYIGCCELLKADGKNLEAVAVYCKYPLSPIDGEGEAPEGDARIHGEIVTLLMKDVKAISKELHEQTSRVLRQLGTSLTVFAKKNGITTVEDWLNQLADIAAFDVCKQVYAAVNGKPLDDPEMVRLFEFKGYP